MIAELLGGLRRDERGVFPGQLGQRLRELLQPAVVGVRPVPDRRIGTEQQGEAGFGFRSPACDVVAELDVLRRKCRVRDDAVVERLAPRELRVAPRKLSAPEGLDDVVSRPIRLVREGREQLVGGLARKERSDERLKNRDRAVDGARVAPRLEVVGRRDVPVAHPRGLVVVEAPVDPERDLAHRPGELEVGRRVVSGVSPDDDEGRHAARRHVRHELGQRLARGALGRRSRGLDVPDGLAGVAERLVDRVRERVDLRRLGLARDHEARAAVRLQVGGHRFDEGIGRRGGGDGSHGDRDRSREGLDLGRSHRTAMVGARSRQRGRRLDDVEPVRVLSPAARDEVAHGPRHGGSRAEEVRLEREDDVRAIERVERLDVLAERDPRARGDVLASGRLPRDPPGLRERGENVFDLAAQRRRGHRSRQEPQPRSCRRRAPSRAPGARPRGTRSTAGSRRARSASANGPGRTSGARRPGRRRRCRRGSRDEARCPRS